MRSSPVAPRAVLVVLVVLAAITRFAFLDADPARLKQVDELGDEGFWSHNARAAVLFGTAFPDDLAQAPASAPLFHWLATAVFRALGVSYTTLRLPSALAATLLVPAVYLIARPELGAAAALTAALLTLCNHELFAFGRLGLPETLHVLFAVASAGVWIHRRTRAAMLLAGGLLGLALLTKLNVLIAAGFAGVWTIERLQGRRRARDVALFAAGAAAVLIPWLLFYYRPHAALFDATNFALNRDRLLLHVSDLGRLPLHFLASGFWGLPSTWLLLVLAGGHVVASAPRWRTALAGLSRVEGLALGWLVGIGVPTALLVRAVGERRIVVLLVPLVLLAGAALARRPAFVPATATTAAPVALALAAVAMWAVDALALLFTGGYGAGLKGAGGAALAAGAVVVAAGATAAARRGTISRTAAARALVAGVLLVPGVKLGGVTAWLVYGDTGASMALTVVVAVAATAAGVIAVVTARRTPRVATLLVVLCVAYGAFAIGSTLLRPTFTVRDASRHIDALVAPGTAITGAFAHALSFDNHTLPIWYTPHRAFNQRLNADLARFDIGAVLLLEPPSWFTANPADLPFALEPVERFHLYPAPGGRGRFKAVVVLNRVRRSRGPSS